MFKPKWILDNTEDCVQEIMNRGEFYEADFLEEMRKYVKPNSVIADIGANIGNHTVYFSKFFDAKEIYVIEPIARSYRLLLANIALNYCHNVNVDYIGLALGHTQMTGYPALIYGDKNLGGMRLNPVPYTDININNKHLVDYEPVQIVTGDSIFENIHLDFLKIDVETMEMVVLEGLVKTIEKCHPRIFIEVEQGNQDDFEEWMKSTNYEYLFTDYTRGVYNHMIKWRNDND